MGIISEERLAKLARQSVARSIGLTAGDADRSTGHGPGATGQAPPALPGGTKVKKAAPGEAGSIRPDQLPEDQADLAARVFSKGTDDRPEPVERNLQRLARAIRDERRRGRAGHWSYDLNRHLALVQAFIKEQSRAQRDKGPER